MAAPGSEPVDPGRAALLVMDYQAGILARIDGADALVARVADTIALVRRRGARIGYVRVAFSDDEVGAMPGTSSMGRRVRSGGRAMHVDSPATAIDPRLAPLPGDLVVRKTRVGPFLTTDLADLLAGRGVDTLILAGLSTSGVVLSTVRDGADRDYRLLVLSDACADPDPDVHAFLVERIFPRQAEVITAADLDILLRAPSGT